MISKTIGNYTLCITDISDKVILQDQDILVQGAFKLNYIPSVNTMYGLADSKKWLQKDYVDQRHNIWYHLQSSGYKHDSIPQDCKLTIELGFYLIQAINQRDLDNMIKYIQDTLAEYFCFNDNRVYQLACYKRLLLNSDKELVHFRIKRSNFECTNKIDYRLISSTLS